MAATNPLSITWRDLTVGGSSDVYQLNGPHVISKSYERFQLVFEVIVVATSYADLDTRCATLEAAFSTRLADTETLVISMDGNDRTYTNGSTIFNPVPTITKTGNPDTDYGYARAYTVTIEGDLPEESGGGLRDFEVLVELDAAKKRIVTIRGAYYASSDVDAYDRYAAGIDTVATAYLDFIDSGASWELVTENYTVDKPPSDADLPKPHTCNFLRQYVELIYTQAGTLDDAQLRDHSVQFRDVSPFVGGGREEVNNMRRVVVEFVSAVDKEQTTDLDTVIDTKVVPWLKSEFVATFSPSVWTLEDLRKSTDRTGNRISVMAQFVYLGDGDIVTELEQSVTYQEIRQIDYTPVHNGGELEAYADIGFVTLERRWDRTVVAVGSNPPMQRITGGPSGDIGAWTESVSGESGPDNRSGTRINESGWNIISSVSQSTPRWVGDPSGERVQQVILTESVVERFHSKPGASTVRTSPVTGRGPSRPITGGGF